MNIIGKTTIHPVLFYSGKISGYFTWIIYVLLFFNIDIINRQSIFYYDWISSFLFVFGLILIVMSSINLGSSVRLGLPIDQTIFKTSGIYKISRNPMYLGFNLWTIASILYTINLLIILLGVYSIIIYHFIILGEEHFLNNQFGNEYSEFKNKVRRYI